MWVQPGMYSPKSGYFEGTVRSFNPSVQRELKEHFISIIRHIAKSLEVDVAFEWGVTPACHL